jgi:copper transport protein
LVAALAALLGGALLFAAPASAHATLLSSSPADGARLAKAPASVTLSFDEPVGIGGLGYLNVTDQEGRRVESGSASHPGGDGTKVTVPLKSGLGDGTYTASYRVVSADSHPVAGTVRFVVGNGPLVTTPVATGTSDRGVAVVFDGARWVSWAGFALLGGGWLLLTVWPAGRDDRRAKALVWTGVSAAAVGAALEVLLEGAYAAGRPLTSAVKPSLVNATLHADYGQLHSLRLLLLGALAIVLGLALQPRRSRLDAAFWPLVVGIAYTFSAVGHAATDSPVWLSIPADMLHLLAMVAWVGGLVLVLAALLPRREPEELHEALPVFSRVAFTSVVVLAVTGTYAAWRGVGSWRALVQTEYGLLVLAKVAAFVGLIALGNLSRRVIQRRVRRPVVAYAMASDAQLEDESPGLDAVSMERMRRSVLVEVVVAAVVLALTSVLVSQPRGAEALAAQAREPVSATTQLGGGRSATVTVAPGQHGIVRVAVALSPGSTPTSLTGTATQPTKQIGPIPLKFAADGRNAYTASGVDLPVAGKWVIVLVVTSSQFDAVTADVTIPLN